MSKITSIAADSKRFSSVALSKVLALALVCQLALPSAAFALNANCKRFTETLTALFDQAKAVETSEPLTLVEQKIKNVQPPLPAKVQLESVIREIETSNPELAAQIKNAVRKKESFGVNSLKVDLSKVQKKMADFVEGPFTKVTGPRGVSEPFVKIEALSNDAMVISHQGDKFPMLVKWEKDLAEPVVGVSTQDGKKYVSLSLPEAMTSASDLKLLEPEIHQLISGSRMNPYIAGDKSLISKASSLLHDGKLIHDRPTQLEFLQLRNKLDNDVAFRKKVDSLLFVAPTATGKTRILGSAVKGKVSQISELLKSGPQSKKLSVVMANTPDLVNQLAVDIGTHLKSELSKTEPFRILQWGGQESEKMTLAELTRFVEKSDKPVVLVTSSQTLAARVKSDAQMKDLFHKVNGIFIDEAHNSGGATFKRVMRVGHDVAQEDRLAAETIPTSLDILGVTASPLSRTERTVEVFKHNYWGSIDSPGKFAQRLRKPQLTGKTSDHVLEWVRIQDQYRNARLRGEITSPAQPSYFKTQENGLPYDTIFKRSASGTAPKVDTEKLKDVWKIVSPRLEDHGPGVIHAYPRDADNIASVLSAESGKNFVSLTKLSPAERDAVTTAFQKRTLYKGKPVDAIVGRIREGLDFPEAGWYLSFKKYMRFPENLQGQGRVVRLSLDKLTPEIIYFGENIESVAFTDVRELVLKKLGRLPRKFGEGRGFKGVRLPNATHPDSTLGNAMGEFNVAVEATFRQNPALSKLWGDVPNPNPKAIEELQKVILRNRVSGESREIAQAVRKFVYEVNAFPFYQGSLNETWKSCDKLLKVASKGKPFSTRLSEAELAILNDPAQMEAVKEFRSMKNWMGSVPRALLENVELRASGANEVAEALNAYIKRNHRVPAADGLDVSTFGKDVKQVMSVSPEHLYDKLNYRSRVVADPLFVANKNVTFEENLKHSFERDHELPDFYFDKMDDGAELTLKDHVDHKLAERFQAYLNNGTLDFSQMSSEMVAKIDESKVFGRAAMEITQALENVVTDVTSRGGTVGGELTFESLLKQPDLGVLRVMNELADKSLPNAISYRDHLRELLGEVTP